MNSDNPFDIKTQPLLYAIFEILGQKGIVEITPFDYTLNSANYAGHEVVTNISEKIFYLLLTYEMYNNEGAASTLRFRRYYSGTLYTSVITPIANASSFPNTTLQRNPILISNILSAATNASTYINLQGFKIVTKN